METAIIIFLLFMLLIAVIILIDIDIDRKGYKIIIQDCASSLDKSRKENSYLLTNNDNLKIRIDSQDRRFNKLKISSDFRDSKINELETKYQLALDEIFQKDEQIRFLNYEVNKYDKTNKQYSQRVYELQTQRDIAKHEAIVKANQAMNLSYEMVNKFKDINSELKSIESQLLRKLKS